MSFILILPIQVPTAELTNKAGKCGTFGTSGHTECQQ